MQNKGLKFFIKTYGCQMNDRDSEALAGLLIEKGLKLADDVFSANIILINTCSVREHAEQRALSFLETLKGLKKQGKIIGLIGCMAKNKGEELFKKLSYLDLVVAPSNFDRIPYYLEKIKKEKIRIIDLEERKREEFFYHSSFRFNKSSAYVVISTGCSNFCSYCIVPFVRGRLMIRDYRDVVKEIKQNVDMGIKKITLLGQNVNDYVFRISQDKVIKFVDLLAMIEKIEGIEEINFITSHPKNTTKDLFFLMASSKKIKKHLHLPFQSGSNKILKLMRRGYTKEKYLELVEEYKKIVKGTISTDIIVGFPYEEEEDFLETKELLEKIKFKYAYIFKYSPRPHTESFNWPDTVPLEEKEKRHNLLLELQKKISLCG